MKLLLKIFPLLLIFIIFSSSIAGAHGGVQNSTKTITTTFYISPLVPIKNKQTKMTFILLDKITNKKIINKNAILKIKETGKSEDEDRTIFQKNVKSDENGVIDLSYIFTNEKIYDIDLSFSKNEEDSVGFLVEPKLNDKAKITYFLAPIFTLIGGIFLGFAIAKKR